VLPRPFSRDPVGARVRLREQLAIYSYQFKAAATTFQKVVRTPRFVLFLVCTSMCFCVWQDRACLSGKVGGMKVHAPFFSFFCGP
jgi:F0F1-type ATP synthase assembly protein I